MPADFFRANRSIGLDEIGSNIFAISAVHPIQPGRNEGVGNYVLDPTSADFTQFCLLYINFVNQTVRSLYPEPKGVLLDALNVNLDNFYGPLTGSGCPQIFPFGRSRWLAKSFFFFFFGFSQITQFTYLLDNILVRSVFQIFKFCFVCGAQACKTIPVSCYWKVKAVL